MVRVWLPDRPGALGAVASRIGAVRGDVVGIEILETGGGQAVDELVVRLPRAQLLDLLVAEIEQVDGARVEEVRTLPGGAHDPGLAALELAAGLMDGSIVDPLTAVADHVRAELGADWVAAVEAGGARALPVLSVGPVPSVAWLAAYVEGHRAAVADGRTSVDDDVTSIHLPAAGVSVVMGRAGRPFRARERRQLAVLARIADVGPNPTPTFVPAPAATTGGDHR